MIYGVYNMLIYTHMELYYIYVLYDIIYLLQSVPPSGSVFLINKRIEYQKTVVRVPYTWKLLAKSVEVPLAFASY